jgi:UDPglucose 6-dehydrogenase
MRVTIFGTGYVGLVTGTCLAEVGHDIVCVDIDAAKVEGLNRGVIPIYEPGLEPMVKANHAAGRLKFTTDAAQAIAHGEILFIAVGTADKVRATIAAALAARSADVAFDVVSNPEFLKEGAAVEDCMRPDRNFIGADSP